MRLRRPRKPKPGDLVKTSRTKIECQGGPLKLETVRLASPHSGTLPLVLYGQRGRYVYKPGYNVLEWKPE